MAVLVPIVFVLQRVRTAGGAKVPRALAWGTAERPLVPGTLMDLYLLSLNRDLERPKRARVSDFYDDCKGIAAIALGRAPVLPPFGQGFMNERFVVTERADGSSESRKRPAEASPVAIASPGYRRAAQISPPGQDVEDRRKALLKWASVVRSLGPAVCPAIFDEASTVDEQVSVLEDYLASRATGTLSTRAAAWSMYFRWAEDAGEDSTFSEKTAYLYLRHLRAVKAPPTRASAFVAAVALTGHLLAPGLLRCAASARLRGAAILAYGGKRPTRRCPPLTMLHLRLIEEGVIEAGEASRTGAAAKLSTSEGAIAGFWRFACTPGPGSETRRGFPANRTSTSTPRARASSRRRRSGGTPSPASPRGSRHSYCP